LVADSYRFFLLKTGLFSSAASRKVSEQAKCCADWKNLNRIMGNFRALSSHSRERHAQVGRILLSMAKFPVKDAHHQGN
jgi:muconolactone delta-isomerase